MTGGTESPQRYYGPMMRFDMKGKPKRRAGRPPPSPNSLMFSEWWDDNGLSRVTKDPGNRKRKL